MKQSNGYMNQSNGYMNQSNGYMNQSNGYMKQSIFTFLRIKFLKNSNKKYICKIYTDSLKICYTIFFLYNMSY